MKRNHRVLILGNAVAGRVIDFNFYAENPIPSEWKEIDWGSSATQSLDVAELKLSERLGLHQNPYYLDSIKDRHTNDDWRGKGNRRKVLK